MLFASVGESSALDSGNSLAWFLSRSYSQPPQEGATGNLSTLLSDVRNRFFKRSSRLIKRSVFTENIRRICCRREQIIQPWCFWRSVGTPFLGGKKGLLRKIERRFPVNPTAYLPCSFTKLPIPEYLIRGFVKEQQTT